MMAALRRYLMAGLLVWVPLGVTLLIVAFLVDLMDQTLRLLPEPKASSRKTSSVSASRAWEPC